VIKQALEQIDATIKFFKKNHRSSGSLCRRRTFSPTPTPIDEECEFCILGGIFYSCGASIPELIRAPARYSTLAERYPQSGPIIIAAARTLGFTENRASGERDASEQEKVDRACGVLWFHNDSDGRKDFVADTLDGARKHLA